MNNKVKKNTGAGALLRRAGFGMSLLGAALLAGCNGGGGGGSATVERNVVYFAGQSADMSDGYELWRTDGTDAGTYRVKDIIPGTNSSNPKAFTEMGGKHYFFAKTGVNASYELWSTDGTEAGTARVKSINPSWDDDITTVTTLFAHDGLLYFAANDGTHGREPWVSDGTEAGTRMLADINAGGDSVYWNPPWTAFNGAVYFPANDPLNGATELWRTTAGGGAERVHDLNTTGSSFPQSLTVSGDGLYMVANDGISGKELWRMDGTSGEWLQLTDVCAVGQGCSYNMADMDGQLMFSLDTTDALWRSDGTVEGTVEVKDINPNVSSELQLNPGEWAVMNGKLYVVAYDESGNHALWESDGTTDGTRLAVDTNSNLYGSPIMITAINDQLFFQADTDTVSSALLVSDGTQAGTSGPLYTATDDPTDGGQGVVLTTLNTDGPFDAAGGGSIYFAAHPDYTANNPYGLFISDGTEAGTRRVSDVWVLERY